MTTITNTTPMVTWGLWHPEHGFTQFLLIDRAVFLVLSTDGKVSYTFWDERDAATMRSIAVEITAAHEARGWTVGEYVWAYASRFINFEEFLHAARDNVPWMQGELTAMINETINKGDSLQ